MRTIRGCILNVSLSYILKYEAWTDMTGNGIFSFADDYLPHGTPPAHRYVSPGLQSIEEALEGVPPAAVFTCGFGPLRDVGVEYQTKLKKGKNEVSWHHFDTLTHGFL